MIDKAFMTVTALGFEIVHKILESQKKRIDALERMHSGVVSNHIHTDIQEKKYTREDWKCDDVSEKIGGTSSDPEAAE